MEHALYVMFIKRGKTQKIRRLDKLVDELAKSKTMEKIFRS